MLFTFAHPDSNFAKKEMNMPEKQKSSHTWKSPKTIIAAAAVTSLLTMWNTFATHDRQRRGELDMSVNQPPKKEENPSSAGWQPVVWWFVISIAAALIILPLLPGLIANLIYS